jgi:hypothetical protein
LRTAPELHELQRLIEEGRPHLHARVLCEVAVGGTALPVWALTLGNPSPHVPAVGFFGGVHGLERIGAEVVLAYLRHLVARLAWDEQLHRQLETLRLVFMPVVNPGGLVLGTRANPQGVDLMRNSPVESTEPVPPWLGGQRRSAALPWYRGEAGAPMQAESAALCTLVAEELLGRPFAIALDCHSGFGLRDRLWFPHAHTSWPMQHLAEVHALGALFDRCHPHHRYLMEPQSRQYLTHGDLWDHLTLRACADHPGQVLLPLTLEMGSWLWVKKNPRQLFTRHGIFNPLIEHRLQRVLREHMALLAFVVQAAGSHTRWLPTEARREQHHAQAVARWYGSA